MAGEQWRSSLINGKVAHAYLFAGPVRSRHREEAEAFLQALLCEKQEGQACQVCLACRKAANGSHENVIRLTPDGQSIKIEQIRDIHQQLSREKDGRVICLVEEAEKMTVQAANSLLKLLEEPPPFVVFILVANHLEQILPTIRSRCQTVLFPGLSDEEICRRLVAEGLPPALVKPAAAVSKDLEEARQFCQSEWFAELKRVMIKCHEEVLEAATKTLLILQRQFFQSDVLKTNTPLLIDIWILWCRDLLSMHYNRPERIHFVGEQAQLAAHLNKWPVVRLLRMMELLLDAKLKLSRHVPQQLALEQALLSIKEG
jgi:DNA polymerase-3 subunit delta'